MGPTPGTAFTWTFRLKYNKSTTILHVDPLQSFDSIKAELLRALHQTHPDGLLHGTQIPSSPNDVIFGRPNDIYDITKGWTRLDDLDTMDGGEAAKGAKKRGPSGAPNSSPKAAGLKDNAVLAFKFVGEDDEGLGLDDENWNVVIPAYEDVTGTVNEGDLGGMNNGLT